jgi:hypothetical protein
MVDGLSGFSGFGGSTSPAVESTGGAPHEKAPISSYYPTRSLLQSHVHSKRSDLGQTIEVATKKWARG